MESFLNFKKTLIVCLISLLSSVMFAQDPSEKVIPLDVIDQPNPYHNDPNSWKKGAKIYKKVCWICHGDSGNGQGPDAEELENKPADFNHSKVIGRTDGALLWWIKEGGNGMEPFDETLTDDQIWHLVSYIRKIQNK